MFNPICKYPVGLQVFDLCTGRNITHRKWTALPLPETFIYPVNKIGLAEGQISLLLFYYCKGNTIEDDYDSNIAGVLESPDITRVDKDTDDDPQY